MGNLANLSFQTKAPFTLMVTLSADPRLLGALRKTVSAGGGGLMRV